MNIDITKIKGIILDYGGTLDTGGDHWGEVIWDAYRNAGIAVDKPTFREAYVAAERELARTRHILPLHDFKDTLLVKMQLELQWLSENGYFPPAEVREKASQVTQICYAKAETNVHDAIPVLEELSKRFRLALVSNFYGNIETILSDFKIRGYFQAIVESAVVGVRKPDPEIFRIGVKRLHLKPEEVLVVGDSYTKDIIPAEEAGCQAIWLKGRSWTKEENDTLHPNIIENIGEVLEIFD